MWALSPGPLLAPIQLVRLVLPQAGLSPAWGPLRGNTHRELQRCSNVVPSSVAVEVDWFIFSTPYSEAACSVGTKKE